MAAISSVDHWSLFQKSMTLWGCLKEIKKVVFLISLVFSWIKKLSFTEISICSKYGPTEGQPATTEQ
jgi:hypothetical protein